MKALILSPAKLREPSLQERFKHYAKLCRVRGLALEHVHKKPKHLLSHIPDRWPLVALDERGESVTSTMLAKRVSGWLQGGHSGVVFLIGAADGLSDQARARADWTFSLSKLTLPHQLCFVVLAEQLYRAMAILRSEPYHRN